jgi:propionyl-CoA synthetase
MHLGWHELKADPMQDALKGHLPFAFITLSTSDHPDGAIPDEKFASEVQKLVREQIGAIASLGKFFGTC